LPQTEDLSQENNERKSWSKEKSFDIRTFFEFLRNISADCRSKNRKNGEEVVKSSTGFNYQGINATKLNQPSLLNEANSKKTA
jgi:hypothetical protein